MKATIIKIVLYTIVLLATYGCDKQARYAVVTTLFTGVPPYEEFYGEGNNTGSKQDVELQEDKAGVYTHPLWAVKDCGKCHVPVKESKQKLSPNNQASLPEDSSIYSAELILPKEKLCIKCHTDKAPRRAIRDRLWLHNSVATGQCLACHAAHESTNPAHLKVPPAEICLTCHDQASKLPQECNNPPPNGQKEDTSCLNCHTTHMGLNQLLLKKDYKEVKISAEKI